MSSTVSCLEQRFILFVCGCMKVRKHGDWIVLKSAEMTELERRKHLFQTIFSKCPECAKEN